ncbi:MAG: hypothetical protein J5I47_01945 [Vicingus serpentipes]|nr:hypothetical protein [Vicingus serpentipes]
MEDLFLHTCSSIEDFYIKERIIHNFLKEDPIYTSDFYCGKNGQPDLFNKDGLPLIPMIKNRQLISKIEKLSEVKFKKEDRDIIKKDLISVRVKTTLKN